MTSLLRRLVVSPARNVDLLLAWLVTVVASVLVPLDFVLARPDLAPWTTLCITLAAWLRGRSLGDGPHPSLTPRPAGFARLMGRLGISVAPLALYLWFDAARTMSPSLAYAAVGASAVTGIGTYLGRADGLTAWRPPRPFRWWLWPLRAGLLVGLAAALGALHGSVAPRTGWAAAEAARWSPETVYVVQWAALSGLLGVQILGVGLLPDRAQTLWQRRTAGYRDGRPYRAPAFTLLLAALGPSIGMFVLALLHLMIQIPVSFDQAPVVSLHVFAWSAVVWPPRIPVAVSCVLHEVVPASGRDPAVDGTATDFASPPRGALRLDPLGIKRLRIVHHWVVRVQDPRIEDLDDPMRPLWPKRPQPLPHHVLGSSSFEPDPTTQIPQWHTITVRLDEQKDVTGIDQSSVQTRRMVVLRAYPSRGRSTGRALRTYRWEPEASPGTVQIVDATASTISLQDGDILVLSTEGVARAFELEIGAPVYQWGELGETRPPQLEDYVGAG